MRIAASREHVEGDHGEQKETTCVEGSVADAVMGREVEYGSNAAMDPLGEEMLQLECNPYMVAEMAEALQLPLPGLTSPLPDDEDNVWDFSLWS